jgi:hypothetical protein
LPVCCLDFPAVVAQLSSLGGSERMKISKGQHYRTRRDIPVTAMTSWAAPFTGGYERILRAGEEFTVANDPPATATAVYCDPKDYRKLHREFIPVSDRFRFWIYRGYYLCIKLKDIEESCETVT